VARARRAAVFHTWACVPPQGSKKVQPNEEACSGQPYARAHAPHAPRAAALAVKPVLPSVTIDTDDEHVSPSYVHTPHVQPSHGVTLLLGLSLSAAQTCGRHILSAEPGVRVALCRAHRAFSSTRFITRFLHAHTSCAGRWTRSGERQHAAAPEEAPPTQRQRRVSRSPTCARAHGT
jgi:hypothetical protein